MFRLSESPYAGKLGRSFGAGGEMSLDWKRGPGSRPQSRNTNFIVRRYSPSSRCRSAHVTACKPRPNDIHISCDYFDDGKYPMFVKARV